MPALEHPPLACRPSPPQGDVISAFANFQGRKAGAACKPPISPLEGEMPGRAEGGASR
ncbi:MAG: propionyl-coenzyme A carboxylase alpha polypeptide [Mesorhizobium sp.]|nr:MAG: propionyl-coenzyme A carboxylase alpha polypeptide [Mesorhizobium sp.]